MESVIDAVLFHGPDNIEKFRVRVTDDKHLLILKKLESERVKIIDYLRTLESEGKIKSIFKPKSKDIQKDLNNIIESKRLIKDSIIKIKTLYE